MDLEDLYRRGLAESWSRIRKGRDAGDLEVVRQGAHNISGSARMYGDAALGDAAGALENWARQGGVGDGSELYDAVEALL